MSLLNPPRQVFCIGLGLDRRESQLAPLTVLEFAEMASEAGGTFLLSLRPSSDCTVPPNVLSVLPGYGTTTGQAVASHHLIRKVDVTVRLYQSYAMCSDILQAGTETGRALGAIVGSNLAAYTAELGGKVRSRSNYF